MFCQSTSEQGLQRSKGGGEGEAGDTTIQQMCTRAVADSAAAAAELRNLTV